MQYVMSDIHGDLAHFRRMLKKIGFLPPDKLYILGDVLDKGCEHLRMLAKMAEALMDEGFRTRLRRSDDVAYIAAEVNRHLR